MEYTLTQCVWELTTACNLRCKHCGSNAGEARENELSLDECLRAADDLVELGCKSVTLIGGEVLLCGHWNVLAKRLIERGIRTAIITNGFNVGINEHKTIKESGVKYISVSVDGMENTHDMIRSKGSFSSCIKLIKKLKRNGYAVSVITTVSYMNIEDIEPLSGVLSECKIDAWQIQMCAPFGRADDKSFLQPTERQLLHLLDFVVKKRDEEQMFIVVGDNLGYFTRHEQDIRSPLEKKGRFGGCSAGLKILGIDSIGNVRGCEALYDERFIEGNIRDKPLKDIWNDKNAFSYNRNFDTSLLSGKCAACDVNHLCSGGCRSMNYFCNGKLYESSICVR